MKGAPFVNQTRDLAPQDRFAGVIKKLCESRIFHRFDLDGSPTHIMQLTAD